MLSLVNECIYVNNEEQWTIEKTRLTLPAREMKIHV